MLYYVKLEYFNQYVGNDSYNMTGTTLPTNLVRIFSLTNMPQKQGKAM